MNTVATAFSAATMGLMAFTIPSGVLAQQSTEELAKAAQNPIAAMISVPFQNNTNFNVGPFNRAQDILNIQPVVPINLNADWNLISRTIIPLMLQPSPTTNATMGGLGDITESLFLSPSHPGSVIWGVGPVATAPTATDTILGTGKWLPGRWSTRKHARGRNRA